MTTAFVPISAVMNLIRLSPGRRLFAFRQVLGEAKEVGWEGAESLLGDMIAHEVAILDLKATLQVAKKAKKGDKVMMDIDSRADRLLGAIYRDCRDISMTFDDGDPLKASATLLHATYFPNGVGVFTTMSYAEQHAEMERIERALTETHHEEIVALGLAPKVKQLTNLTKLYGERLNLKKEGGDPSLLSSELRAKEAEGHEHLCHLVASICVAYPGADQEQSATRTKLLQPILLQQENVRDYYRRRRPVLDIDPDTGEPTLEEA